MNKNNLVSAFSILDINNKRNAYNEEIIKLCELLKVCLNVTNDNEVFNYNLKEDQSLNEDEYLVIEYKNILLLRELIINY